MNTPQEISFPTKSAAARFLFPALVICGAAIAATAAAQDAAKTHTLFMGADVSVGIDKQLYAVRDVSGSSWVVEVNGQTRVISTKNGPINLKVTPSLKLTEISANIADLKGIPAYSFENDPSTKLTKAMASAADLNAGYQAAVNQSQAALVQAQNLAQYTAATNNKDAGAIAAAGGIPILMTPAGGALNSNLSTAAAAAELAQTSVSAGSDLELPSGHGFSGGFDAMEVSFGVSSQHRLNNPYVVTITRFQEKGGKPGMFKKLVYAKAVHPIESHPTTVHFYEEGFPPGFELQSFEMHLYDHGVEVATSVSSKRVELTRDEAFEYVKLEYVGAHKGDTLPAVPVMGRLPADLPARLAEGKYADTYYVRVSKDGVAGGPFLDAACTKGVRDPYLESVVKNILFKPALDNGRPVEGVAPVRLGQLTM